MNYVWNAISSDSVFITRILIAMVLGAFVGLERQIRGREAGLRTNILVCLGSAAIIVAFQKLSVEFSGGAESAIRMDPARAAAGVITGIGFLGAGTIIKSNDFVRGLTTSASIWVVAAIGVTVGLGEYVISCLLTLLVLIALYALHRIPIVGDHYFSLTLKWEGGLELLSEITEQLRQEGIQIRSRSVSARPKTGKCKATLVLCMRREEIDDRLVARLQQDERLDEIAWH